MTTLARWGLAGACALAHTLAFGACNATAEGDAAGYKAATAKIAALAEFRAWPQKDNATFGAPADKQTSIRGRCYWSVAVASNDGLRANPWQTFLVPVSGSRVLVVEPNGKLRASRARTK